MKTKEEMIQEIRRVVIMANNPEYKTYDEFLDAECKKPHNIVKLSRMVTEIRVCLKVTLERVLVALNSNKSYIFISDGYAIFRVMPPAYAIDLCKICDWAPNKTLDNQSQETIETIYKKLIS